MAHHMHVLPRPLPDSASLTVMLPLPLSCKKAHYGVQVIIIRDKTWDIFQFSSFRWNSFTNLVFYSFDI